MKINEIYDKFIKIFNIYKQFNNDRELNFHFLFLYLMWFVISFKNHFNH